jgi:hypothetical protein
MVVPAQQHFQYDALECHVEQLQLDFNTNQEHTNRDRCVEEK